MNTAIHSDQPTSKSTEKPAHIVLVEDDVDLLRMLSEFLQKNGFSVSACGEFEDMRTVLADYTPDLFVLDLMLPDKNGIEISQYIRAKQGISTLPILILTAQDNELLEVTALNEGATSYLNKPVRPHVLLAHINALLNQQALHQQTLNQQAYNQQEQEQEQQTDQTPPKQAMQDVRNVHNQHIDNINNINHINNIGLVLDTANLTATLDGNPLSLSTAEFELLQLFRSHKGKTISRDFLMNNVRGMEYDGLNRSVDMRISTLRKKLGDHKPPYRFIKTIRGKGYLFVEGI